MDMLPLLNLVPMFIELETRRGYQFAKRGAQFSTKKTSSGLNSPLAYNTSRMKQGHILSYELFHAVT